MEIEPYAKHLSEAICDYCDSLDLIKGQKVRTYLLGLVESCERPPHRGSQLLLRRIAADAGLDYEYIRDLGGALRRHLRNITVYADETTRSETKPQGNLIYTCFNDALVALATKLADDAQEINSSFARLVQDVNLFHTLKYTQGFEFKGDVGTFNENDNAPPVADADAKDRLPEFSRALDVAMKAARLDPLALSKLVPKSLGYLNPQTVRAWVRGENLPRNVTSLKRLRAVEQKLKLEDGYLLSKLPKVTLRYSHPELRDKKAGRFFLPQNMFAVASDKRSELLDFATEKGMQATPYRAKASEVNANPFAIQFSRFASPQRWTETQDGNPDIDHDDIAPNGKRYRAPSAPPRLDAEMNELIEHMTRPRVPIGGLPRRKRWVIGTAMSRTARIGRFLGMLHAPQDSVIRGYGARLEDMTLMLLAFPQTVDAALEWAARRREFLTESEKDLLAFAQSLLNPIYGWLTNNPLLLDRVRPIPGVLTQATIDEAKSNWLEFCANTRAFLANRRVEILEEIKVHREAFVPIETILYARRPYDEYMKIVDEIRRRIPDRRFDPVGAAETYRDLLMARMGINLGLRSHEICDLRLCPRGKEATSNIELGRLQIGEIRWHEITERWLVYVPKEAFKNRTSRVWDDGEYTEFLLDEEGLYDDLAEYITHHRSVLIGHGTDPGSFFVRTSRLPNEDLTYTSGNYASAFRKMTARFAVRNPHTGQGALEGVLSFGPHSCRHIRATHILKAGGSEYDAAASICDSVTTVRKYYIRYTNRTMQQHLQQFFQRAS